MHRFLKFFCAIFVVGLHDPAFAISRITSPNVTKGELEVEYQAIRTFDDRASKDREQSHSFELEYGLTDRLKLDVEGKYKRPSQGEMKFDKVEAGATIQFFERGRYYVDSGVKLTYAHPLRSGEADAIEAKLLLEKSYQKWLHRANIGLENEFGAGAEGGSERSIAWGTRYRYSPKLAIGGEWQADLGRASDHYSFDEQEHYIGPAAYGSITDNIKYEASYLFGVSDAAADAGLRLFLEYEVQF